VVQTTADAAGEVAPATAAAWGAAVPATAAVVGLAAAVANRLVQALVVASLAQECQVAQWVDPEDIHPMAAVAEPGKPAVLPEVAMERCLPEGCLMQEGGRSLLCLDHPTNCLPWASGHHLVGHPFGRLVTLTDPVCFGFSDGCGCDDHGRHDSHGGPDHHGDRRDDRGHCDSRDGHDRHANHDGPDCHGPDSHHGRGYVHHALCCVHDCDRDLGCGYGFSVDRGLRNPRRVHCSAGTWMATCHLPVAEVPLESLTCSSP